MSQAAGDRDDAAAEAGLDRYAGVGGRVDALSVALPLPPALDSARGQERAGVVVTGADRLYPARKADDIVRAGVTMICPRPERALPFPTWPDVLLPQHLTAPVFMSAQACLAPTAICLTPLGAQGHP